MLNLYYEYTLILILKKIPVQHIDFNVLIWKILASEDGEFLVLELRDSVKQTTSLSVVSTSNSTLKYTLETLPKPWWIGLKSTAENTFVLQGFKDGKNPDVLGMFVYDLTTGVKLWEDTAVIFLGYDKGGKVLVQSTENLSSNFQKRSLSNGTVLESNIEIPSYFPETENTFLVHPHLYTEENVHYTSIAEFIQHYSPIGPIEYCEFKNYIIIAYYNRIENVLTNKILIIDEQGEELTHDVLMSETKGIGMSSFFICKDKLIYVKNKKQLRLVELI